MKEEQCLVLVKPDGLKKSLTGDILSMLSKTELVIVGAKIVQVTRELAEEHWFKKNKQILGWIAAGVIALLTIAYKILQISGLL